ncbi:MAG: helix-turn-helix domain-containing protein [Methylococcales bacterium]|nr:helix-turn-helix domain-containing protein [Methylococcales bacterium]
MMLERQRDGIAKAAGKYKGRTPLATDLRQKVVSLVESGMAKTKVARELNIGETTVYRILATSKNYSKAAIGNE